MQAAARHTPGIVSGLFRSGDALRRAAVWFALPLLLLALKAWPVQAAQFPAESSELRNNSWRIVAEALPASSEAIAELLLPATAKNDQPNRSQQVYCPPADIFRPVAGQMFPRHLFGIPVMHFTIARDIYGSILPIRAGPVIFG